MSVLHHFSLVSSWKLTLFYFGFPFESSFDKETVGSTEAFLTVFSNVVFIKAASS